MSPFEGDTGERIIGQHSALVEKDSGRSAVGAHEEDAAAAAHSCTEASHLYCKG